MEFHEFHGEVAAPQSKICDKCGHGSAASCSQQATLALRSLPEVWLLYDSQRPDKRLGQRTQCSARSMRRVDITSVRRQFPSLAPPDKSQEGTDPTVIPTQYLYSAKIQMAIGLALHQRCYTRCNRCSFGPTRSLCRSRRLHRPKSR